MYVYLGGAEKVGFVFQAFNLLEALSVEDNILFPPSSCQVASPRPNHGPMH